VKLTAGDDMRDRIIGALDTGCRCGEMMKIQNKHVDWRHRWIRILKEHSKTEVARVIPSALFLDTTILFLNLDGSALVGGHQFSCPYSISLVTRQRILHSHGSVPLPVGQIFGVKDLGASDLGRVDHQRIPE
jgi:integrase